MELFNKMAEKFYENMLPSIVIPLLKEYAGEECKNLRMAILLDRDVFELYREHAEEHGIYSLDEVRGWAERFPSAKPYITAENVKKWLKQLEMEDFLRVLETTPGGDGWFEKQITKFREGLFG